MNDFRGRIEKPLVVGFIFSVITGLLGFTLKKNEKVDLTSVPEMTGLIFLVVFTLDGIDWGKE